jgi:hypothetical protein
MIAQIGEVLATYWRRAISSRLVLLAVIVPVIGIFASVLVEQKQIVMAIWMGIYGPALIALHFKQQIIQISQRRIPHAVAPHVIVVVGLLVLCGVGLPAARMAIGIWSWGALGFVFALTAVTFALFAAQTGRIYLLITLFIFMACFDSVQHWLEDLCQRRHEAFGLPLLAAGICSIAGTLAWLLQMSEENPGYFGRLDPRSYPRRDPSTDDAHARAEFWKALAWRLVAPPERQVQLWPQWGQGSLWQRIRLWRVGHVAWFPLGLLPESFAYLLVYGVGVMSPAGQQRSILVKGSAFLILFFPVWMVVNSMWQQRKTAAIESLRPVGRSQYLIDTGLAYAYGMAVEWGLNSIAWCGLAYVLVSADWSEMLSVVVLTAAFQVLFFGLTAWVIRYLRFTTFATLFAFGIAGLFLTFIIPIPWATGIASVGALRWVTPGIAVAGALITWDAYRRWMRTEMG